MRRFDGKKHLYKIKADKGKALYFIPASQVKNPDILQGLKKASEQVQDEMADTVKSGKIEAEAVNTQLKQIKRDKIQVQIQLLQQKLQAEKRALFAQWSDRFYTVFQACFTKLRKGLIDLHLQGDQVQALNRLIIDSLKSLKISLDDVLKGDQDDGQ